MWEQYTHSYDRIANRVLNREDMPSRQEAAKRLLGWMVCAKPPLLWHEIRGAASISLSDSRIEYESRCLRVDAKELCGSLVDVDACGAVVLVYSTAQKYVAPASFYTYFDRELLSVVGVRKGYLLK
jgi:hypothetical protein